MTTPSVAERIAREGFDSQLGVCLMAQSKNTLTSLANLSPL